MARQGNQAISKTQIQANRRAKQRLFLRLTYIILFISVAIWAWSLIHNPKFFPVKQVVIRGSYTHVDPNTLKSVIQPFVQTSLLSFNERQLKQSLQSLPWIATAEIHRHWPDTINIMLTEKIPVAQWGKQGLVTQRGLVFFPAEPSPNLSLPIINTRPDLIPQALEWLNEVNMQLMAINLKVVALSLSQRESLSLVVTTAAASQAPPRFVLLLGHNQVQARLKRFIDVYPNVFESRINEVQYVDMRYTNGMAVKWNSQNP